MTHTLSVLDTLRITLTGLITEKRKAYRIQICLLLQWCEKNNLLLNVEKISPVRD